MATIDAVSYFTDGLCVSYQNLDAVSYFTLGLVLASVSQRVVRGGGVAYYDSREEREEFARKSRQEAEFLALLIAAVAQINADND